MRSTNHPAYLLTYRRTVFGRLSNYNIVIYSLGLTSS